MEVTNCDPQFANCGLMRTGVRDGRFVVHAAFVPSLVVYSEHDVAGISPVFDPVKRAWP